MGPWKDGSKNRTSDLQLGDGGENEPDWTPEVTEIINQLWTVQMLGVEPADEM